MYFEVTLYHKLWSIYCKFGPCGHILCNVTWLSLPFEALALESELACDELWSMSEVTLPLHWDLWDSLSLKNLAITMLTSLGKSAGRIWGTKRHSHPC